MKNPLTPQFTENPSATFTTETRLVEPSPSPTPSPKSSGTEPPLQTTQPDSETQKIMHECVAKEIILLFLHSTSDFVFNVTPLTSLPPQFGPSAPNLTISSKPAISSQPRTTTSAPSCPRKESEEENLSPRRRRTSRDDIRVIRRTQQRGESSQTRAKIVLRTSGAEDLDYIPADVLEEHRLAQEALELKKSQD